MKPFTLLLFSLLIHLHALGQTGYATELRHSVKIPNSPAAEAFQQYGDINVNLYTGTPDIQIPLFTYRGQELDLPMALTYDPRGVRVDQASTQIASARVSRVLSSYSLII